MKKFFFSIVFVVAIFFVIGFNAQAEEFNTNSQEVLSSETYEIVINENESLIFETENDMQLYLQSLRSNKDLNTITADTLISTTKPNGVFGGYITPNWTKSSGYSVAQGKSYSFSASYSGIGLSFTFHNSVTTSIPANATKYSKLGMYADFTIKKYKRFYPNMSSPSYYYKKTVRNSYLRVVYK